MSLKSVAEALLPPMLLLVLALAGLLVERRYRRLGRCLVTETEADRVKP